MISFLYMLARDTPMPTSPITEMRPRSLKSFAASSSRLADLEAAVISAASTPVTGEALV